MRDWRDLSGALRVLHAYAGFPSAAEMEKKASDWGALPHSTARRIINARSVPTTQRQLDGFLKACEEPERRYFLWSEALTKCLAHPQGPAPLAGGLTLRNAPTAQRAVPVVWPPLPRQHPAGEGAPQLESMPPTAIRTSSSAGKTPCPGAGPPAGIPGARRIRPP